MASNKMVCKKCRKLVSDNCNSICCDNCSNWFHQKRNCSVLKTKDFNKFVKNTQFSWVCTLCHNYKCACDKPVFDFQNGIRCDLWLKWLHLKCTRLSLKNTLKLPKPMKVGFAPLATRLLLTASPRMLSLNKWMFIQNLINTVKIQKTIITTVKFAKNLSEIKRSKKS